MVLGDKGIGELMFVRKLDHYNIRTTRYPETVRFYVDVLGMRHDTEFSGGNWIYDGSGVAAVHLIVVDPADPQRSYKAKSSFRGGGESISDEELFYRSGAIDHVAFECTGYGEMVEKLCAAKLSFHENLVTGMQLRQIFVKDPNGITLELNFR